MSSTSNYTRLDSGFGRLVVVWTKPAGCFRVQRVLLPGKGDPVVRARRAFPGVTERTCAEMTRLGRDITRQLSGVDVRLDLRLAALEDCPAFQQKVLRAEHAVPRGRVTTYGRLAVSAGSPGAARAAGSALANNPFPLIIPCHRAVKSDGNLGDYQGGRSMKRALLELEGVRFTAGGKVQPDFILP